MRAIGNSRTAVRRAADRRKLTAKHVAGRVRPVPVPPAEVLYRICKPGWAVRVEKVPSATGTRFVCPFCPNSHRVPGPVRGFRKMPRPRWIKVR
ncbi:MAG: hypothetical protein HY046_03130, partial [Acidobacteria bacterium]|nr:hypothetical protein [Acidobacteriota bacterium]